MPSHFDIIVIGLGGMGCAALYQLARRGVRVLGLDRFEPPHQMGSSHAETRITRLAVGEGPQYLPLVARSHEIWRELEAHTGQGLLHQCGGYIIEPEKTVEPGHWQNFVTRTEAVAVSARIEFEMLAAPEVRRRHPNLRLKDTDRAGYEPTGGVVMAERAVAVQLNLARRHGATIGLSEPVENLSWSAGGVTVKTGRDTYHASKAIVTTGGWMADFVPADWRLEFAVTRQVVFWFRPVDPAPFSTARFPFIIWAGETVNSYFSAFPMPAGGVPGLKCLTEQYHEITTADAVSRTVLQQEIDHFYDIVAAPRIAGLTRECVQAAVCLYTNTPDDHFVIDSHPESDRVLFASPCSGHGFKHSAAIGESLAQMVVDGRSQIDLSEFRWRF